MMKRFLKYLCIILFLLSVLHCTVTGSGESSKGGKPAYGYTSPMFSPDNGEIIFGLCKSVGNADYGCTLATYEISTNKLRAFNPTGNKYNNNPSYSKDRRMIAFNSGKERGDLSDSNIYIMNTDGTGVRQLTHDYNDALDRASKDNVMLRYNVMPAFSPDTTRIIFIRAGIWRERSLGRGKMLSHWDVYEIDLETGKETKLTDYRFYTVKRPYYLPDGRRFIFSGDGPKSSHAPSLKDDYEKQYKQNTIFIMDGRNNDLRPAFTYGWYSTAPSIARDGSILFEAITNEMDGIKGPYNYDLFIKKGEKINRLTKMAAYITQASISPDGSHVVFLADTGKERGRGISMWMMKSDGTELKKIKLPYEQILQSEAWARGKKTANK